MLKYYNILRPVDNDTIMICELCVSTCKYTRYTRYHLVLFVMIATVHESIATYHMPFTIIDARNPWKVGSIWGTWYPCSRYLSAIPMNVQKVASDQTTKIDPKFFFLSSFSLPLPLLLSFSLPFLFPSSSFPFPFLFISFFFCSSQWFSFLFPFSFSLSFSFPLPFLFLASFCKTMDSDRAPPYTRYPIFGNQAKTMSFDKLGMVWNWVYVYHGFPLIYHDLHPLETCSILRSSSARWIALEVCTKPRAGQRKIRWSLGSWGHTFDVP